MSYMDLALYDAVTRDDVDSLEQIEKTLSVGDQLTPTNSTVLHLASQYGSEKCVARILRVHKPLLLEINSRGETPLHLAAKQGQLGVVKALIDSAKTSLQQQSTFQNTTASTAVQDWIRTPDEELETALHRAVRYNCKDVVELLVREDPSHLHPQNKYKETPLYLASLRYYTDIITVILDNCKWTNVCGAGGKMDLRAMFGGPEGRTALHAAVLDHGGQACVELLLERNKALIKEADDYGWTVFHYVAYNDLDTIVEPLVGANKYVAYLKDTKYERTALHVAAYQGNLSVMKKFVEFFPDSWEVADGNGRNILHIAIEENREKVISFILSRGFEATNSLLTKRDKNGNTPLHLIAKLGCYVPELMTRKALNWQVDWEVLDSKNCTPLDVLHSEQETHTLANQVKVRKSLINANVRKHWRLWRILKEPEAESGKRIVKHTEKVNKEEVEEYRTKINSQSVVSALIATVAFTALYNVPGGYDGNQGPGQGSPVLLRKEAFAICIFSAAMALFFSVTSIILYFVTTFNKDSLQLQRAATITALFNFFAILFMMYAFLTGTYAVLAHSSQLALSVCATVSGFFLIAIILYFKIFWGNNAGSKSASSTLLPSYS